MFNVGAGELILIVVVALLVLGPQRLPEFARAIGKFVREFRRQTDEVRTVVEREFYKMDQEFIGEPRPQVQPPTPAALALAGARAPCPLTLRCPTPGPGGGPEAAAAAPEASRGRGPGLGVPLLPPPSRPPPGPRSRTPFRVWSPFRHGGAQRPQERLALRDSRPWITTFG